MFVLIAEFFSPDHPLFKAKWSVIAAIFVTKANFIFVWSFLLNTGRLFFKRQAF